QRQLVFDPTVVPTQAPDPFAVAPRRRVSILIVVLSLAAASLAVGLGAVFARVRHASDRGPLPAAAFAPDPDSAGVPAPIVRPLADEVVGTPALRSSDRGSEVHGSEVRRAREREERRHRR